MTRVFVCIADVKKAQYDERPPRQPVTLREKQWTKKRLKKLNPEY